LAYLSNAPQYIHVDENRTARFEQPLDEESVRVEYRLVCSGTLVPSHFHGDWSHSDGARILLRLPVELLVASRPYEHYPQELVLRFIAPLVSETNGSVHHQYHPDGEVAADLAALLTLFCRRLITVSVKMREQYAASADIPPILADFPIPAVTAVRMSHWKQRPVDFLHGLDGVHVESNQPRIQPFDSSMIMRTLLALPKLTMATAIVRAARLYASAMERVESQPDTSYQFLISAVETVASAALEGWKPSEKEQVDSKSGFVAWAMKGEGLSKDVAERLALQAAKDNPWASRKFKRFILDNLERAALDGEDDLFIVPNEFYPKSDEIDDALGEIYHCRSGATHSGHALPHSAAIGPTVRLPTRALDAVLNQERAFPPVGWFERVVNNAICRYIWSQIAQLAPAASQSTTESK
jgi:hypothetical protein